MCVSLSCALINYLFASLLLFTDMAQYAARRLTTKSQWYSANFERLHNALTTLCLKKVPNCLTLSNLHRFSKFWHCWKAYEICYKACMTLPPHLRHVATLAWEIKNSNFLQMWKKTQKILHF